MAKRKVVDENTTMYDFGKTIIWVHCEFGHTPLETAISDMVLKQLMSHKAPGVSSESK